MITHQQRAFKIAVAFVATFTAVHYMGFHERSWPLITLCVLLIPSDNTKHVHNRALQRIAGTVIGAAIGVAALYLEKLGFVAMLPLAAIGAGVGAYYARSRFSYAATVIAITMAVVMNAPAGDLHTAFARICGIAIGAVFASVFGLWL